MIDLYVWKYVFVCLGQRYEERAHLLIGGILRVYRYTSFHDCMLFFASFYLIIRQIKMWTHRHSLFPPYRSVVPSSNHASALNISPSSSMKPYIHHHVQLTSCYHLCKIRRSESNSKSCFSSSPLNMPSLVSILDCIKHTSGSYKHYG